MHNGLGGVKFIKGLHEILAKEYHWVVHDFVERKCETVKINQITD